MPVQVGGAGGLLKRCKAWLTDSTPGHHAASVELSSLDDMGPLLPLLDALLPAGAQLGSLELQGSVVPASALQDCPQLSSLTALHMLEYAGDSDIVPSIAAPLELLLPHAPRLARLTLDSCFTEEDGGELPACLVASTGLQELSLAVNFLQYLSEGSYLGPSRCM